MWNPRCDTGSPSVGGRRPRVRFLRLQTRNVGVRFVSWSHRLTRMVRFVHARDVSDLGEVMDLVCYIVPHFVRRYSHDNSPCKLIFYEIPERSLICLHIAFLRNDLVEISRWAAETRPCGPEALKKLIEDLHREVVRILEVRFPLLRAISLELTVLPQYDKMCNRFSETEKRRCVTAKNN